MDTRARQRELGIQILENCRNELCDAFPYLDSAFSCLRYESWDKPGFAVDGSRLYFSPPELLRLYRREPARVRRGYLHLLLHCLYLHLFSPPKTEPELWRLACDIAVEQQIEALHTPRLGELSETARRCLASFGELPLAAERVVRLLEVGGLPCPREELQRALGFDSPELLEAEPEAGLRERWERLQKNLSGNRHGAGHRRGDASIREEEEAVVLPDTKNDYHSYLRQFTVMREELELDPENFDYIYYHLGLSEAARLPLIEPLEYREVYRLEELVIAIDTSGSCSMEAVSGFLAETWAILSSRENFFQRMNVFLIQCDCVIQDAERITCREDWLRYARKVKIRGRGGTDFRPVFDYVEKLREQRQLRNLKALLYFSDGDGIYPTRPPDYEVSFVIPPETGRPELLPPWARLLQSGAAVPHIEK